MSKKIFIGTFVVLAVFISAHISNAEEFVPEDSSSVVEGGSEEFVPEDSSSTVEGDSEEEFVPEDSSSVVEGEVDSTPEVTSETTTSGSSSGSRARGGNGGSSSLPTTASVLGATTGPDGEALMCSPYLISFLKIGRANDVVEVKKLQTFLNEFNNANLPVTGYFGPMTDKAVKDLQTKYAKEILQPWDNAGLSVNLQATGYVYKMTVWFINNHKCPEAQTPVPVLK